MNDYDAFQAHLDANPDDHTCRLVKCTDSPMISGT